MAEYRVKVRGANSDPIQRQVAVTNIAELNANIARIESLITYEIHRNLPQTITVASVAVQFMVDAIAVEGTVTYVGEPKDIVDLHNFLVSLPRLVFERLPKILSDSGIIRVAQLAAFDVSSAPIDPLPAPPKPGYPPPAPPVSAAPVKIGVDWWNRAMQIVIIMLAFCAVVLVIVAIVVIVRLGFFSCVPDTGESNGYLWGLMVGVLENLRLST